MKEIKLLGVLLYSSIIRLILTIPTAVSYILYKAEAIIRIVRKTIDSLIQNIESEFLK